MHSIAVIGAGYWGPNLIRNFRANPAWDLVAVCDLDEARARKVVGARSTVEVETSVERLLARDDIDAVAIATPAKTHAPLALAAFQAGKHVLVEKPLADNAETAAVMVSAAEAAGKVLMIDHTFCYTPAVQYIRDTIASGELGDVLYIDSTRINLGLVQPDVDVFWDLAPHDLSILDFILPGGLAPTDVTAHGADPLGAGKACVGYLNLPLANGAIAHVNVNWLSPTKIRQMVIGGSRRTLVWDDMNPAQRISIHDRGVDLRTQAADAAVQREAVTVSYRMGDVVVPALKEGEALAGVATEFAAAIEAGRAPQTDGRSGLRVLSVLEAASASLASGGPVRTVEQHVARGGARRVSGVDLAGATTLVTGGAGTIGSTIVDQLLDAGVGEVRILDNLVRGRRGNLRGPLRGPAGEAGRRRPPRPRPRARPHGRAPTSSSTRRRSASRSAPRSPGWRWRCWSTARSTSSRRPPRHKVSKLVAASSASVYGLAEEFPTTEHQHPYDNDTFYGAAKTFNEGMLRSFRAMSGLDYVALRYFNVYGPRMDIHGLYTEVLIRWMERIVAGKPPLIFGSGAQTMDFVFTTDIARANLLAATSPVVEGVYNVARGEETSLLQLAERLLAVMGSDLGVEHGPGPPGQRRDPPPREHRGRRRATSASPPRSASTRGCAGSSTGGAARRPSGSTRARTSRTTRSPSRQEPWHEPRQRDAPLPRRGGGRGGRRGPPLRLGGPGSAGRRVRGGLRHRRCRPSTPSPCRRAPRACTWPWSWSASARATRSSSRRSPSSPRATPCATSGATPVFADVDVTTGNLTPETVEAALTERTRAVVVVDQGGVPVDLDAIRAICDPRGIAVVEDAACGAGSTYRGRPVGAGAEIAAWSFHPRKILTTGEGGMVTTSRRTGPTGPARSASTR